MHSSSFLCINHIFTLTASTPLRYENPCDLGHFMIYTLGFGWFIYKHTSAYIFIGFTCDRFMMTTCTFFWNHPIETGSHSELRVLCLLISTSHPFKWNPVGLIVTTDQSRALCTKGQVAISAETVLPDSQIITASQSWQIILLHMCLCSQEVLMETINLYLSTIDEFLFNLKCFLEFLTTFSLYLKRFSSLFSMYYLVGYFC